jgi:hypothetical protein
VVTLAHKFVEGRHDLLERHVRVIHPCGDVVEPFVDIKFVGDAPFVGGL